MNHDTDPAPPPATSVAAAYHASEGLSWSRLRTRAESELAYAAYDPADSDTFRTGRALHSITLGGDRVVVCPMRRDTRVAAYRDWAAEHAGCIVLTEAQHAAVVAMADAVGASRLARIVGMLSQTGAVRNSLR